MKYQFYTADVFTDQIFTGNPLAVFPEAEGLTIEQMQRVAREINYSETVFVLPADNPDHFCRLRIFTPGGELPFAGHPTLGTAYVLASVDKITLTGETTRIVFEEGVGPIPVAIQAENGRPVSAQLTAAQLPELGPPPPSNDTLAAVLSLETADIGVQGWVPQAVSCGVPFLFIPVRDRAALGRINVNRDLWQQHLADYWAPHLFGLTFDVASDNVDVQARMFAPAMGIAEDPATGAAVTALGGYLTGREFPSGPSHTWRVVQGVEMGRPSLLVVTVEQTDDRVSAIHVSGASVLVSEGLMEIPGETNR